LSAANVLFIYSAVGPEEAPAGGLGDGVSQKLEHNKVHSLKFKAR